MHRDDDYFDYLAAAMAGAEGDRKPPKQPDGCITRLIGLALLALGLYWMLARFFHH
jgi:hypothetical protein